MPFIEKNRIISIINKLPIVVFWHTKKVFKHTKFLYMSTVIITKNIIFNQTFLCVKTFINYSKSYKFTNNLKTEKTLQFQINQFRNILNHNYLYQSGFFIRLSNNFFIHSFLFILKPCVKNQQQLKNLNQYSRNWKLNKQSFQQPWFHFRKQTSRVLASQAYRQQKKVKNIE